MGAIAAPAIRAGTTADLPVIRSLLLAAALPVEDLMDSAPIEFLVAEDRGVAVGAIGLERHGSSGLLRSLVVAPAQRERGLGRALVRAVEERATRAGCTRLVLLTSTAKAFFEALGYVATSRDGVGDALRASTEFRTLCPAEAACLARDLPTPA